MKRIFLGVAIVICLVAAGSGVYLALEEQQKIMSYSAVTTATVLEKRVEQHQRTNLARRRRGIDRSLFVYEPVVRYRYEVEGRPYTGANIYPKSFRLGGNLGYLVARAPLDRFEVGQTTRAYFNPENPSTVCLIRRPSSVPYLVMLAPVLVVSILAAVFGRVGPPELIRRKAGWITGLWLLWGVVAISHYLWLTDNDFNGLTVTIFALYMQLGLIPLMIAMPPASSSRFINKVKVAFGVSMFGTFIGFWLGLLIGGVTLIVFSASITTFLKCWGYTMAISAVSLALVSLAGEGQVGEQAELPDDGVPPPEPRSKSRNKGTPPEIPIPYGIDARPLPSGDDFDKLLPLQIGSFQRKGLDIPSNLQVSSIYAKYQGKGGDIFVEFGPCDDAETAWKAVETAKAETVAEFPEASQWESLGTEPSFFKAISPRDAWMAWTRGRYYFSAHARGGEKDLDTFLTAFPY
jgi:hypothetical protein